MVRLIRASRHLKSYTNAIYWAARRGDLRVVDLLLDVIVDVNISAFADALCGAVSGGKFKLIHCLVDGAAGVCPSERDQEGHATDRSSLRLFILFWTSTPVLNYFTLQLHTRGISTVVRRHHSDRPLATESHTRQLTYRAGQGWNM